MSAKPKKSSKAPKPNCKVWIQVGEEELTEYLTKPIDGLDGLDGVDAFESYVVVALGDVLTVHCQAKPGIVDEFALATDGIFRACETRRHAVLIFDKALHRSKGKGKQQAAVYRSDMVVQMRNEKETRRKFRICLIFANNLNFTSGEWNPRTISSWQSRHRRLA